MSHSWDIPRSGASTPRVSSARDRRTTPKSEGSTPRESSYEELPTPRGGTAGGSSSEREGSSASSGTYFAPENMLSLIIETEYFNIMDYKMEYLENIGTKSNLVKELIHAEMDYINDMDTVMKVYLEPLEILQRVSINEVWKLFSDIQSIITIHQKYCLSKVQSRLTKFGDLGQDIKIGDILTILAEELIRYETYISNLPTALGLLSVYMQQLPENKFFLEFIEITQKNPKCRGLSLALCLKKPLVHLYKYPILIKNFLRLTPTDEEDYKLLEIALDKMNRTIEFIRYIFKEGYDMVRQQMEITTNIAKNIEWAPLKLPINRPGRFLIKKLIVYYYETFYKIESDSKSKYAFDRSKATLQELYLMNDTLLLCTPQKSKKSTLKLFIPFHYLLTPKEEEDTISFLHSNSPDIRSYIYSEIPSERKELYDSLINVLQIYQQHRFKRKDPNEILKRPTYSWLVYYNNPTPELTKKMSWSRISLENKRPITVSSPQVKPIKVGSPSKRQLVLKNDSLSSDPIDEESAIDIDKDNPVIKRKIVIEEIPDIPWNETNLANKEECIQSYTQKETNYLEKLISIEEVFLSPVEASGMISKKDIDLIFTDWPKLIDLHTQLLAEWNWLSTNSYNNKIRLGHICLGKFLTNHIIDYSHYQNRISNHLMSTNTYLRLLETSSLHEKQWFQETLIAPSAQGMTFSESIALPLKWPTVFLEFLKLLNDNTPEIHPDSVVLRGGIEMLSKMLETAKELQVQVQKIEEEAMVNLSKLEKEFQGAVHLVVPGRKILTQINAKEVIGHKATKTRDVIIYLLSDVLLISMRKKLSLKLLKIYIIKSLKCTSKCDMNLAINAISFSDAPDQMMVISFDSENIKNLLLSYIQEGQVGYIVNVIPPSPKSPEKKFKQITKKGTYSSLRSPKSEKAPILRITDT